MGGCVMLGAFVRSAAVASAIGLRTAGRLLEPFSFRLDSGCDSSFLGGNERSPFGALLRAYGLPT